MASQLKKKVSAAAILAILSAAGYGGYSLVKDSELANLKKGTESTYQVKRVIDGDTFELEDGDMVRLLGINAPDEGECYFKESKLALQKLIQGKNVELRKDVTDVDDFGRFLRYVILPASGSFKKNIIVDEYMVREGYADTRPDPRERLYYNLLVQSKEQAMKENKGLWAACKPDVSEISQADVPPSSESCLIKGNVSTASGQTYFLPECRNYSQIKIDPSRGEKYFCTEKEAKAAGFKPAANCP